MNCGQIFDKYLLAVLTGSDSWYCPRKQTAFYLYLILFNNDVINFQKVIAAIKAKKAYYTTTTTTMAAMTGRKKRDVDEYDELDIDSTYRILNSIEDLSVKYG